jgi:hypothetical protein
MPPVGPLNTTAIYRQKIMEVPDADISAYFQNIIDNGPLSGIGQPLGASLEGYVSHHYCGYVLVWRENPPPPETATFRKARAQEIDQRERDRQRRLRNHTPPVFEEFDEIRRRLGLL